MKTNYQNCMGIGFQEECPPENPALSAFYFLSSFFLQKHTTPMAFSCVLLLLFFATGCKDPYDVRVRASQQSVLVVEGFLNSGGITSIKLSRSSNLNDNAAVAMESGASVVIESGNVQYQLAENGAGTYSADLGVLNPSAEYRLHINTNNGTEYVSDYVKPRLTPSIDSLNWTRDGKGVTIYANTHDAANSSLYYKYDYEETWETHANYISYWAYDLPTKAVYQRGLNDIPYQCWKNKSSSNINLATSTALQTDVIFQKPLVFLPNADEKLHVRYSILVKQYVLSKEAYEFFGLMKKNTESLGTVFDPQPSELTGNIRPVNDQANRVIGFFYASSEQQKRIFIDASEVPGWNFMYQCSSKLIGANAVELEAAVANGLYPYDAKVAGIRVIGYYVSETKCFDCTVTGGNRTKPSFW